MRLRTAEKKHQTEKRVSGYHACATKNHRSIAVPKIRIFKELETILPAQVAIKYRKKLGSGKGTSI